MSEAYRYVWRAAHISTEQNGRLHQCPCREMRPLFLGSEVSVTDLHHVHVVVCIEHDGVKVLCVLGHDLRYIRPIWLRVVIHTPGLHMPSQTNTRQRTSGGHSHGPRVQSVNCMTKTIDRRVLTT